MSGRSKSLMYLREKRPRPYIQGQCVERARLIYILLSIYAQEPLLFFPSFWSAARAQRDALSLGIGEGVDDQLVLEDETRAARAQESREPYR